MACAILARQNELSMTVRIAPRRVAIRCGLGIGQSRRLFVLTRFAVLEYIRSERLPSRHGCITQLTEAILTAARDPVCNIVVIGIVAVASGIRVKRERE